jgi:hypothetical protein
VDAAVTPARILCCQAQHQQADGADGARPTRAIGTGPSRVTACQQVPVPGQADFRAAARRARRHDSGALPAGHPLWSRAACSSPVRPQRQHPVHQTRAGPGPRPTGPLRRPAPATPWGRRASSPAPRRCLGRRRP